MTRVTVTSNENETIAAGEELLITYSEKSPTDPFTLRMGFVGGHNPHDSVQIFVNLPHAAGWYDDVPSSGFVGGGGEGFGAEGDAAEYDYGTKDLAVDLASPLVAYKLVTWALNQEIPIWLDAIIIAFTLAAVYVCVNDVDALDDVLV